MEEFQPTQPFALIAAKLPLEALGFAGGFDAGEAGVRDDVEALLAAIVGVGAPADVGDEARRMAKPALLVDTLRGVVKRFEEFFCGNI